MHRSRQRGAVRFQDSSAQQASSGAHRTRAPCKPYPQLVPWAQCSGATHGTAVVGLGRKAVFSGVMQSLMGSCSSFWGPTSSFGRGMSLDIPGTLSAVK